VRCGAGVSGALLLPQLAAATEVSSLRVRCADGLAGSGDHQGV